MRTETERGYLMTNDEKIKQLLQQVKREKSSEKRQLQIIQILELIVETL